MPTKSRWSLSPLHSSIPSFIFDPATACPSDPDHKIFIDARRPETHYWTRSLFLSASRRFAAGLVAAGLKPGDRVMLVSGNSIFTPVVVMGVLMAGGIFNSANPAFTSRELAYQLKDCEPRFVLAADNCLRTAKAAVAKVSMAQQQIFLFAELRLGDLQPVQAKTGEQCWSRLVADAAIGENFVWQDLRTPEGSSRTALLLYSSGTTGLPKGVELSHFNIVTNMRQLSQMQFSDTSVTTRRGLCILPMFHGLGLVYYTLVALKMGVQVYLMKRYNLEEMLGHISRLKITELILVPPVLAAMAQLPSEKRKQYDLSSVKKVVAGVAPIGKEVSEQFEELWHGRLRLRQAFGMTEAPCITFCWDERDCRGPTSTSIGELVPGVEAKLVAEEGTEVAAPGARGELFLRAPNIMKGYWRNPKATQATMTSNGWLSTGDIAYRDKESKWYIVDRKKELIKVRGAQVAPAELEALLLEHPQIIDAAVIGVRTATDDEDPKAFVVPRNKDIIREEDVCRFVDKRVAKLKRLTGGVALVDAIPRNPSGKILRRVLRDRSTLERRQARL